MTRFLVWVFLLLSLPSFGQVLSDTLPSKVVRRFSFGINISPDYCYRALAKNDKNLADSLWDYAKNIEDSIEVPKFGYTVGINVCYQLNKRLSTDFGIQYSNKGYGTISMPTVFDWDPEFIPIARTTISFHYLDLPLKLNYLVFDNKAQLMLGAGLITSVFLKATYKSIPDDKSIPEKKGTSDYPYSKIILSPTLSAGLKYNIDKNINFRAEPSFRYTITNIDSASYKSTHLWSIGLNFGFYYAL